MKNNLIIMATITLFSIVAVLSCVIIGAMLLGKIHQQPAPKDLQSLQRTMLRLELLIQ